MCPLSQSRGSSMIYKAINSCRYKFYVKVSCRYLHIIFILNIGIGRKKVISALLLFARGAGLSFQKAWSKEVKKKLPD